MRLPSFWEIMGATIIGLIIGGSIKAYMACPEAWCWK